MENINGKTKILGVIGNPIEHTLSPVIHNTLCDIKGINAVYVPIHVEQDIEAAVKGLYASGFSGLNITVPYKQEVMGALVGIDALAEKIGAVNTLVPDKGGFKGYNTDMPGLKRALESKNVTLDGKKAIVIGAGGAARAVCVMLEEYGASKVYLVNRSIDKAEAIASELSVVQALALADYKKIPKDKYLMFQCTSVGLKPDDGLVIDDDDFYRMSDYGYDLIYNPAQTPFIKKLNDLRIRNDNGLSMLLYQGIIAFEYWFDVKVSEEEAERVLTKLRESLYGKNIVLTGYMGCGKSSVGKKLAEKLGMTFVDTDEEIVKREGKSINEIFAESGENGFRQIETEVLKDLSYFGNRENSMPNGSGMVIATGGGIVLKKENMPLLKNAGKVFYLRADAETTFERVKQDSSRPLLSANDEDELKNKISSMLIARKGYYEIISDEIIDTEDKNIEEVADVIIERLKIDKMH
ncbi:MAG: shikimate dehydrogenase [Eubacterium sp.]|nr:shikimate dehydrogenase [Eubacterium sp.]